ncbi:LADA_0E01024g1_1 [Lachancea dasiensis]|uniref:LADA_0E01024g1_1 n=1 Tax=Lachancea dasiensis TaxID=1072105 RepID=A0A1G4JAT8_9SACH|nr:LADA_0E01024g1_1 [Lachancea dasiensis]
MLTGSKGIVEFASISSSLEKALEQLLAKSAKDWQGPNDELLSTADRCFYYELIKELTQAKVHIRSTATHEESIHDVSRKKAKLYRLLSQEELVNKIWNIIANRIDQCADEAISHFIEELALETHFEAGFVRLWPACYLGSFEYKKRAMAEAFNCLTESFPVVLAGAPGVSDVCEFADYRLIEAGIAVIGDRLHWTITELFRCLRRLLCENSDEIMSDKHRDHFECLKTFLRIMQKCPLVLPREQRALLKKLYFDDLRATLLLSEIPVDYEYLSKVKSIIIREKQVTSCCMSDYDVLEVKRLIVDRYILGASHLGNIVATYALTTGYEHEFSLLKLAHKSADKSQDLYSSLSSEALAQFRASFQKTRDLDKILDYCGSLYALNDLQCEEMVKNTLRTIFDGELRVLEPLLKTVDLMIKRSYRLIMEKKLGAIEEIEAKKNKVKTIWRILRAFDLVEPFLKLFYEKSLFRRILLMGQDYLKHMDHSFNLEKVVLDELELYGTPGNSLPELSRLRRDLEQSKSLQQEFCEKSTSLVEFVPLVFERKNVPMNFLETPNPDVKLPPTLQLLWNRFQSFYQKSDNKSILKPLILQNALHHLEVQTFFKLPDGSPLVLEVTLLQASLLEIFNSKEEVNLDLLISTLDVTANQAKLTIQSFRDVDLLKETEGTFYINNDFKPDVRKLKNGRLRIVHRMAHRSISDQTFRMVSKQEDTTWLRDLLRAKIVGLLKQNKEGITFDALRRSVEKKTPASVGENLGQLYQNVRNTLIYGMGCTTTSSNQQKKYIYLCYLVSHEHY